MTVGLVSIPSPSRLNSPHKRLPCFQKGHFILINAYPNYIIICNAEKGSVASPSPQVQQYDNKSCIDIDGTHTTNFI